MEGVHKTKPQIGPTKTAPLLINTIEMRVLWMGIKYIKSASRLLDRAWVNKGGLDLSKEVLWVSVGQKAAELPAIKVGGQKKILPSGPVRTRITRARPFGRIFFKLPTLMAGSFAVLWPTKTHSTSLKRSKPPLLTQTLFMSLAALLVYFMFVQSTLISIGLLVRVPFLLDLSVSVWRQKSNAIAWLVILVQSNPISIIVFK